MKAILLAGGQGTRLRPLTLNTPKPIVPIFDRPFLHYQIDRLKAVPEIDEVILSLNYQPDRIEEVLGDGTDLGLPIRYVVEPAPLGTGGAIKYAARGLSGTIIVFNGDVLTEIDLAAVVAMHREQGARATIVLTPVDNPADYGLVETDAQHNITNFVEKPRPGEIPTNNINAGIYVLESDTFDRIPDDTNWSIERGYFPTLVTRGERFLGFPYAGYWIDIGTPAKYRQVHRDIMDGQFGAGPFRGSASNGCIVAPSASVAASATLTGPCFVGEGTSIAPGATIGPHAVIGRHVRVGAGATVRDSIVWPECEIGAEATLETAIIGRGTVIGVHATVSHGAILGDDSRLTAHSRT